MLAQLARTIPSAAVLPKTINAGALAAFLAPVITEDRARLLLRLKEYGLRERTVTGDGACQFRSLSDQLYRTQENHDTIRAVVVAQLKAGREKYEMYVPQKYSSYLAEMAKEATWGDHITLQAFADTFGVQVMVLTSFKTSCCIKIKPQKARSTRVLWLAFWAEVHYNSIYPAEE
ncbi:hypothetical protein FOA52_005047 [Chlamydomonas sp. UWO 241]|nr:hypothetical protein FOA52_005047 [Chlamydomonas sp. UWO 241]